MQTHKTVEVLLLLFVLFAHLRLTYKVINLVNNTISIKEFGSHTASASLAGICAVDWLVDGRANIIRNIWMRHCEALDKHVGFEETIFRHGLSLIKYGTAKAGQRKTEWLMCRASASGAGKREEKILVVPKGYLTSVVGPFPQPRR